MSACSAAVGESTGFHAASVLNGLHLEFRRDVRANQQQVVPVDERRQVVLLEAFQLLVVTRFLEFAGGVETLGLVPSSLVAGTPDAAATSWYWVMIAAPDRPAKYRTAAPRPTRR